MQHVSTLDTMWVEVLTSKSPSRKAVSGSLISLFLNRLVQPVQTFILKINYSKIKIIFSNFELYWKVLLFEKPTTLQESVKQAVVGYLEVRHIISTEEKPFACVKVRRLVRFTKIRTWSFEKYKLSSIVEQYFVIDSIIFYSCYIITTLMHLMRTIYVVPPRLQYVHH